MIAKKLNWPITTPGCRFPEPRAARRGRVS
jgi:hypothetical protein